MDLISKISLYVILGGLLLQYLLVSVGVLDFEEFAALALFLIAATPIVKAQGYFE